MKGWRIGCAMLLLMLMSGCSKQEEAVRADAAARTPASVAAVRVTRSDLTGVITLTGEFVPFQEVEVMAKVAGYIRSIRVDIGDRVRRDQVLATLEVPEMENEMTRARAAIEQANAEATRAGDDVRRSESAYQMTHLSLTRIENVAQREPGLVPRQEVDEVRSRDLQADAQVAAAESNAAAARERIQVLQAEADRLKTMRNYLTITAPFDGVVTKRYANTGDSGAHFAKQSLETDSTGARIVSGASANRPRGECQSSFAESNLQRENRAIHRPAATFHTHHGHGSGCAESRAYPHPGHVCRSGSRFSGAQRSAGCAARCD